MFYENEFPKLNNNNSNLQQSRIYFKIYFKITLILGLVIKQISIKRKKIALFYYYFCFEFISIN